MGIKTFFTGLFHKAKADLVLEEKNIYDFVARLRLDTVATTVGLVRVAKGDALKLTQMAMDHLRLQKIHDGAIEANKLLEERIEAAEQEADAIKKEWEHEEAAARAFFQKLSTADGAIEELHTILGEAGIELKEPAIVEKVKASIERRIEKPKTAAVISTAPPAITAA